MSSHQLKSTDIPIGLVPSTKPIENTIKEYGIPHKSEWSEGDIINNAMIYSSKMTVVRTYFWVCEVFSESRDVHIALCHISDSLKDYMLKSANKIPTDIFPDTLVCAYYEQDSSWHRGLVEKIGERRGKMTVTVRFLDYGNVEEVSVDMVSILPAEFTQYPFQFRLCQFSDDVAMYDREVRWKFMDLVKGRRLGVKVIKREYTNVSIVPKFSVELYDEMGVNIGQTLQKYMEEKSSLAHEDFPFLYTDIRYKDPRSSKTASPQPSVGLLGSHETLKTEDTTSPNTTSDNNKNYNETSVDNSSPATDQESKHESLEERTKAVEKSEATIKLDGKEMNEVTAIVDNGTETTEKPEQEEIVTIDKKDESVVVKPAAGVEAREISVNEDQVELDSRVEEVVADNDVTKSTTDASSKEPREVSVEEDLVKLDGDEEEGDSVAVTKSTAGKEAEDTSVKEDQVKLDSREEENVFVESSDADSKEAQDTSVKEDQVKSDSREENESVVLATGADSKETRDTLINRDQVVKLDSSEENEFVVVAADADSKEAQDTSVKEDHVKLDSRKEEEPLTNSNHISSNTGEEDYHPDEGIEMAVGKDVCRENSDDTVTPEITKDVVCSEEMSNDSVIHSREVKEEEIHIESPSNNNRPAVIQEGQMGVISSPSGSQINPSSSRASSLDPITSPSQMATQSQPSDTGCSLSSSYNESIQSLPPPDVTGTTNTAAVDRELEGACSTSFTKIRLSTKSTSHNLTLNLTHLSLTDTDREQEETKTPAILVPKNYVPPFHPIIFNDAKLILLVNSCLSPEDGTFWGQLMLPGEEQLLYDKLSNDLQSYSATKGEYTPVFFEPGDLCMALYSEDGLWYRGRIEEHNSDKKLLLVRFMDYGNSEYTELPNLMALKNEFRQLPFQAIKCSIADESSKLSFSDQECQVFDDCLSSVNRITATVLSFNDQSVRIKANLSETDEDLLNKIVLEAKVPRKSGSFDMPRYEDTKVSLWADRMEDENDDSVFVTTMSDTELLTIEKQRRKKSKTADTEDSHSEYNMKTTSKKSSNSRSTELTTTGNKSKSAVITQATPLTPSSSSSSVNSHSSHGRLSVDKTFVNKYLFTSSNPGKEDKASTPTILKQQQKQEPLSINNNHSTGTSDYHHEVDKGEKLSRVGRSLMDTSSKSCEFERKKEVTATAKKGRGVLSKKWGSSKEIRRPGSSSRRGSSSSSCDKPPSSPVPPAHSSPGFTTGSSSSGTSGTSSWKKKKFLAKRDPNIKTLKVIGLGIDFSNLDINNLFGKYGRVVDIRGGKKGYPFYIDMDKSNAYEAMDKLHGKIPDKCQSKLMITIDQRN